MPHKHTRNSKGSASDFNLPPSAIAKPLPVGKISHANPDKVTKRRKPSAARINDDTPRAFARLLQYQKLGKPPKTLDDGASAKQRKKRKRDEDENAKPKKAVDALEIPKILPGERMSDFSARVNQALPIAGLNRKGKKADGTKERQTKLEKKIQRRIAEWRTKEAEMKEKEEEADDLAEEEEAENWTGAKAADSKGVKVPKPQKGTSEHDDDDPWAKLKDAREKPKGIFDVADAPPNFKRIPREVFKIKNGARADVADVPRAAGSLRKREELGTARKSIIESYRQLMEEKRNAK